MIQSFVPVMRAVASPVTYPLVALRRIRNDKAVRRLCREWTGPRGQPISGRDDLCRTRYDLGNGHFLIAYMTMQGETRKYEVKFRGCTPRVITQDDKAAFSRIHRMIMRG